MGVGDWQGGLVCCSSWGRKESDVPEQLNWTEIPCIVAEPGGKWWFPLFSCMNVYLILQALLALSLCLFPWFSVCSILTQPWRLHGIFLFSRNLYAWCLIFSQDNLPQCLPACSSLDWYPAVILPFHFTTTILGFLLPLFNVGSHISCIKGFFQSILYLLLNLIKYRRI